MAEARRPIIETRYAQMFPILEPAEIDRLRRFGETRTFAVKADSGNINTRHFCPTCGSRLFGENSARPGFMNVTVGTIDDTSWFEPQWVFYKKRQPMWDITTEDVPCHDGMPPPT